MPKKSVAKLTAVKVEALKPKSDRYEVPDGGSGLFLRVSPGGTKSWVQFYRFEGALRRLTLGTYGHGPGLLTLAAAREAAGKALSQLEQGSDPAAKQVVDNKAEREAPTFSTVLEEFKQYGLIGRKSGDEMYRLIAKDCLPVWGRRKVKSITRRDVVLLLDKVRERAPVGANRLHGRLSRMFRFCADRGIIERSPIEGLSKPRETTRERILTDPEIRAFWLNLDRTDMEPLARIALRLILATGQRSGEVIGMTVAELDDAENPTLWTIPSSRYKTSIEHAVPLSPLAADLVLHALELARGIAPETPFVFQSTRGKGKHRHLIAHGLARAVKRHPTELLGEGAPFVPHDLRRTCRSGLSAIGVDALVAEKVLGHKLPGIAGIYDRHDYAKEKRDALNRWAEKIKIIVYGADVVQFCNRA